VESSKLQCDMCHSWCSWQGAGHQGSGIRHQAPGDQGGQAPGIGTRGPVHGVPVIGGPDARTGTPPHPTNFPYLPLTFPSPYSYFWRHGKPHPGNLATRQPAQAPQLPPEGGGRVYIY
jgi:hypothetical protein